MWSKRSVLTRRDAQRAADEFIEEVNTRNNDPRLYSLDQNTVAGLKAKCAELVWPHLKKSTRMSYEDFFKRNIIPRLGSMRLHELSVMQLQVFFNSFHPRLSAKTVKNMHATLRAALTQALAWGMLDRNPAVGVKLPRKKARKPAVVLSLRKTRSIIENLPNPAKTVVTLIVLASMRVGEVLALRWKDFLTDRITVDERVYEGELDDPKTESGRREVPLDSAGLITTAVGEIWARTKFRSPDNFVFCSSKGTLLDRRNILRRQIKPTAEKLGISTQIDFRSFRTMHASLMGRAGARAEVIRDNMGHSDIDVTQNVYGKCWWEERVEAVSDAAPLLMTTPSNQESESRVAEVGSREMLFTDAENKSNWNPNWNPCTRNGAVVNAQVLGKIGRGERI